jgi:hypothetical protein
MLGSSRVEQSSPAPDEVNTMAAMGPYDSSLQMFVQSPQPIDMSRLEFLRWLAERDRLEHRIAGPSSGPLVGAPGARSSPAVTVAA